MHETQKIVKREKYSISRAKNPSNLGSQEFYKISKVLYNANIMPRDT